MRYTLVGKVNEQGEAEMKDWKQIAETETAYWFKNSNGEIISVPKS